MPHAFAGRELPAQLFQHLAQHAVGDGFAVDQHAVAVEQHGVKIFGCHRKVREKTRQASRKSSMLLRAALRGRVYVSLRPWLNHSKPVSRMLPLPVYQSVLASSPVGDYWLPMSPCWTDRQSAFRDGLRSPPGQPARIREKLSALLNRVAKAAYPLAAQRILAVDVVPAPGLAHETAALMQTHRRCGTGTHAGDEFDFGVSRHRRSRCSRNSRPSHFVARLELDSRRARAGMPGGQQIGFIAAHVSGVARSHERFGVGRGRAARGSGRSTARKSAAWRALVEPPAGTGSPSGTASASAEWRRARCAS